MTRTNRGIRYATQAARMSVHNRRVGAALMFGPKLVAIGWNNDRTHPLQDTYNSMQHAELNCLIGLHKLDITKGVLYIVRLLRDDSRAMSKPCESCTRFLKAVGIRKVYYSYDATKIRMENI